MTIIELGQTLRAARKHQKMPQTQLCRLAGLSRPTLSGLENGTIPEIGVGKVMALCSVLGLELAIQPLVPRRPTLQALVGEAEQHKIKGRA